MQKRCLIIVGTRPEAIKMMPLYVELSRRRRIDPILVLTGQHPQMTRDVLNLFGVAPDIELEVMEPGQALVSLAGRASSAIAGVISREKPSAVVVQGDTTSAAIAGLLGFYAGCPVAHVEAGLRTGNLAAPYPEEFNRRVITLAAKWHFAPTEAAAANLRAEGISSHVYMVGNTVIDAALLIAEKRTPRVDRLCERMPFLDAPDRRHLLVTTHRRENFGRPLQDVAEAIARVARQFPDLEIVCPVHPNPAVGPVLRGRLTGLPNVHLVPPLEYDEMLHVIRTAYMVLTDSGGIQEEAPSFGVPVLVLRNETERLEGAEAGCSALVGTSTQRIIEEVTQLLTDAHRYDRMATVANPYGDGTASARIADHLESELADGASREGAA